MMSGITQSIGTAAMSVVMTAVTPRVRLEGTNDRAIHQSRRRHRALRSSDDGEATLGSFSSSATPVPFSTPPRSVSQAQPLVTRTKATYPEAHTELCWPRRNSGSNNVG